MLSHSRPERADFRPERVNFRPERADFRPERAWGDARTDGMTNKSPPVLYRTSSPLGQLPKKNFFSVTVESNTWVHLSTNHYQRHWCAKPLSLANSSFVAYNRLSLFLTSSPTLPHLC